MQGRALHRLYAIAVCQGLAIAALSSLIPAYLHHQGASDFLVGLSFTFWALTRGVFGLVSGTAFRRFGPRTVLSTAMAVFAVATAGFALSRSPWTLVDFRLLQGVAAGLYWTALLAAVAHASPPDRRLAALARTNIIALAMGLIGQPIAGEMARALSPTSYYWISTAILSLVALPLAITLPQSRTENPVVEPKSTQSVAHLAPIQRWQAVLAALGNLPAVVTSIGMPIIFADRGVGYAGIGVEGGLMLFAGMLLQQVGQGWGRRFGRGKLLMLSGAVCAAALVSIAVHLPLLLTGAAFVILFGSLALANLTWLHWSQSSVPDGLLGPLTGFFRGVGDLSSVITFSLFGVLAAHLTIGLAVLAIVVFGVGLSALRLEGQTRTEHPSSTGAVTAH